MQVFIHIERFYLLRFYFKLLNKYGTKKKNAAKFKNAAAK
jgi:hypothetical protein